MSPGRRRGCETGFALLLVFLMAAMVAIMLYLELPRVAFEAQRGREALLMDRGGQYKRAIKLFVGRFGRYPGKIEDLENTNNIRFLRRRYKDPMTGKDEWRLIHAAPGGIFPDSLTMKPTPPNQTQNASSSSGQSSFGQPMGQSFGQPFGASAQPSPTPDNSYAYGAYGVNPPSQWRGGHARRPSEMRGLNQGQGNPQDPNNPYLPYDPNAQPGPTPVYGYNPGQSYDPNAQLGSTPVYGYAPGQPVNPNTPPSGYPGPIMGQPSAAGQGGQTQSGSPAQNCQLPNPSFYPSGIIPCAKLPTQCQQQCQAQNQATLANAGNQPPPQGQSQAFYPPTPSPGNTGQPQPGQPPVPYQIMQQLMQPNAPPQSSGPTTMGAGIAGVASTLEAESIKVFKVNKKDFTKYNEWEFIYDPTTDVSPFSASGAVIAPSGSGNAQTSSPFGGTGIAGAGMSGGLLSQQSTGPNPSR